MSYTNPSNCCQKKPKTLRQIGSLLWDVITWSLMNVITCYRRNRWWNFDLVAVKTLIILQLLNFSPDHSKKTKTNDHIKASSLNTSSARLWDKHGTTYLVYFTLIKCKKTWIGRECGFTNSGTIWGRSRWRKRPLEGPCEIYKNEIQIQEGWSAHTGTLCFLCFYAHAKTKQNKKPCLYAC